MPASNSLALLTASWPKLPASGVPWSFTVKEPKTPEEELRPNGSRIGATILLPWDQRQAAFRQDILESSSIATGPAGQLYISRTIPFLYRDFTRQPPNGTAPFLYVSEVTRCVPRGAPESGNNAGLIPNQNPLGRQNKGQAPSWLLAAASVVLTDRPYDVVADAAMPAYNAVPDEATWQRYVVIRGRSGGSAVNLPFTLFKFVDGGSPPATVSGTPSITVPELTIDCRWVAVPQQAIGMRAVNPAAASYPVDAAIGCVNSDFFPPGRVQAQQFPPGTLLFESITFDPQKDVWGQRVYDLHFSFKFFWPNCQLDGGVTPRAVGWNHIINRLAPLTPVTPYQQVSSDGLDNWPYTANTNRRSPYIGVPFATIFRPPM